MLWKHSNISCTRELLPGDPPPQEFDKGFQYHVIFQSRNLVLSPDRLLRAWGPWSIKKEQGQVWNNLA